MSNNLRFVAWIIILENKKKKKSGSSTEQGEKKVCLQWMHVLFVPYRPLSTHTEYA